MTGPRESTTPAKFLWLLLTSVLLCLVLAPQAAAQEPRDTKPLALILIVFSSSRVPRSERVAQDGPMAALHGKSDVDVHPSHTVFFANVALSEIAH